jgi:hypothetical protein
VALPTEGLPAVAQRVEKGAPAGEGGGLYDGLAQLLRGDVRVSGEGGGPEVAQEAGADAERHAIVVVRRSQRCGGHRRLDRLLFVVGEQTRVIT